MSRQGRGLNQKLVVLTFMWAQLNERMAWMRNEAGGGRSRQHVGRSRGYGTRPQTGSNAVKEPLLLAHLPLFLYPPPLLPSTRDRRFPVKPLPHSSRLSVTHRQLLTPMSMCNAFLARAAGNPPAPRTPLHNYPKDLHPSHNGPYPLSCCIIDTMHFKPVFLPNPQPALPPPPGSAGCSGPAAVLPPGHCPPGAGALLPPQPPAAARLNAAGGRHRHRPAEQQGWVGGEGGAAGVRGNRRATKKNRNGGL